MRCGRTGVAIRQQRPPGTPPAPERSATFIGESPPGPATAGSTTEPMPAVALARCPSRAALPTPARTCLSLPRRTRARQGAPAPCRDPGAAWRQPLTRRNRRGLTAAGSAGWGRRRARDRQHGQAAAFVSPLRCAPLRVHQRWRLRRGENQGDRVGQFQHGRRSSVFAAKWPSCARLCTAAGWWPAGRLPCSWRVGFGRQRCAQVRPSG